ncbi:MAG: response regulator transcription factor [Oscillospiraceae bacterium]|nr:response regulator transcription factor [Oscillospiraceae bacterium]
MKQALIVDDDIHIRKLVITYAENEGFKCVEAENGHQAAELASRTDFDIIILDVMMPDTDGFTALAEIRKISQAPVIMLTARSEEYDKLCGFDRGADDYVSKPFSPKELMARVNAVLKRAQVNRSGILSFGRLIIREMSRIVTIDGETVNLTPKEFDLLLKLAKNERMVLTREQLINSVWGYDYLGDMRTVDTHIKALREHLGECRDLIRTVWGVGYKFEYRE